MRLILHTHTHMAHNHVAHNELPKRKRLLAMKWGISWFGLMSSVQTHTNQFSKAWGSIQWTMRSHTRQRLGQCVLLIGSGDYVYVLDWLSMISHEKWRMKERDNNNKNASHWLPLFIFKNSVNLEVVVLHNAYAKFLRQ